MTPTSWKTIWTRIEPAWNNSTLIIGNNNTNSLAKAKIHKQTEWYPKMLRYVNIGKSGVGIPIFQETSIDWKYKILLQ